MPTRTSSAAPSTRRDFQTNKQAARANPVAGRNGRERGRTAFACVPTAIVSCVVALTPEGVTVVGLKEQVALEGSPEQAKLTVELKPFCGVTVRVADPCEPGSTVIDAGEAAKPNVGTGRLIVYAAATTLLAE